MLIKLKLFFIATFLLLSGCSRLTVSYRFADWVLLYRLDKAFDLTGAQKDFVDKKFEEYLKWNKKQMTPKYRGLLLEINTLIQNNNYQYQDWGPTTFKIKTLVNETMTPIIPHFIELLMQLSPKQVDHFEKYLAKEQKEITEKHSDKQENAKRRFKQNKKQFKFWFTVITEEQEQYLKNMSTNSKFPTDLWLQKRKSQQTTFIKLLRETPRNKQKLTQFVNDYFNQKGQTEIEMKYYNQWQDLQLDIFTQLIKLTKTLTPPQKKKFAKRVQTINFDLNKLAKSVK